jgi:hypothetical protein
MSYRPPQQTRLTVCEGLSLMGFKLREPLSLRASPSLGEPLSRDTQPRPLHRRAACGLWSEQARSARGGALAWLLLF